MDILFLNHNIIGRGTYWRCYHLARALVALGHRVTLVTTVAAYSIALILGHMPIGNRTVTDITLLEGASVAFIIGMQVSFYGQVVGIRVRFHEPPC